MASTHRHATSWTGGRVRIDRRRGRRPIDPTNVRLVGLGVYLALVVLMVLFAEPASATGGGPVFTSTLSAVPSVLFLVVVGGGLVVRTIRRRGHLPHRHPGGGTSGPDTTPTA